MARTRRTPHAELLAEPRRFRFDAAVRILADVAKTTDPAEAARFRSVPGVAYPAAEVVAVAPPVNGHPPELTTPAIGLTGAAGVLPRLYTDVLTGTLRGRSPALHDFLDHAVAPGRRDVCRRRHQIPAQPLRRDRSLGRASGAGPGRRGVAGLHRVCDAASGAAAGRRAPSRCLHYSGFFAGRPRSAERLAALVSDWLGRKVEIVQFAGAWLPLPQDQQTAMPQGRWPGAWNRLGVDAAIGVRAWDPQARIILRIGPLDYRSFAALLPDHTGLQRLVSLVRAFLGFETGFAVNPVLMGSEVPPLQLDPTADPAPRLGWNTWVPAPKAPVGGIARRDADEALFEAEIVEAEELCRARSPMTAPLGDWGGGYVTDIPYLPGYYRHQSPLHLNLACLLGGVAGITIEPTTRLRYIELGCGHGFGALMLAGCNPAWRGDRHRLQSRPYRRRPSARRQGRHCQYSVYRGRSRGDGRDAGWGATCRKPMSSRCTGCGAGSATRCAPASSGCSADKLRPGGIAYLSYNALPAWQGALGMQRLLLEAGSRAGGRSDRRVAAGWETVRAVGEAGAAHLRESGLVQSLAAYSQQAQVAYLAHEYMNAAWRPCFHGDVVRALAGAKLDWVASGQLARKLHAADAR